MKTDSEILKEIVMECDEMSKEILRRLCKRVFKQLNDLEEGGKLIIFPEDYPKNFTFLDKLSIECQSKNYDEIHHGLGETIYNFLEDEYKKLPKMESFIVDHSDYFEPDSNEVMQKIAGVFNDMWDEHYDSKKIQDYI